MNDILIKPLEENYIDGLLQVNSMCFEDIWHKESFLKEIKNSFAKYIVALYGNNVIGYAGIWIIQGQADIISIAVSPSYRKNGVGNLLMDGIFNICRDNKVSSITLEVRKSNITAQNLYQKYDFVSEAVRKAYYSNKEDALIMWNRKIQ